MLLRMLQASIVLEYNGKRWHNVHPLVIRFLKEQAVPESSTFLIMNFQFALQEEEDFKRLNFSRDMLAGLGKNLVFVTTPYVDDQLAVSAYDFYSFVKLRVIFYEYEFERKVQDVDQMQHKKQLWFVQKLKWKE